MSDAPDLLVAIHEAGHAYVAWRCGRACGPVTVRPGPKWAGMAHSGPVTVPSGAWARLDATRPVPLWPAAIRRKFDVLAMTTAAGEAAELALWWPGRTRRGGGALTEAGEIAASLPPSRTEEIRMAASRADTAGRTDPETLAFLAGALWPDDSDLRISWIAYIAAEARHMVAAGADQVERLASALAERGSLSGRAIRAILEGAPS